MKKTDPTPSASPVSAPATDGEVVRDALERMRDDCQSTIDLYHRTGPSFTSPGGDEYEPTSFVIAKMEELISVADAALSNPAPTQGDGEPVNRLDHAREWLRNRWDIDWPNEGHVKQLADYATDLLERQSK